MATLFDQIENQIADTQSTVHHVTALLAGLDNRPQDWEYTGNVYDSGPYSNAECCCGHPIRYMFEVKDTKSGCTTNLGSTCIDHYKAYRPCDAELMEKHLAALLEKQAAVRKAAQAVARQEKVIAAAERYKALRQQVEDRHWANRRASRRSPYDVWAIVESCRGFLPLDALAYVEHTYVRACDSVKWIEKQVARMERALEL